MTFTPPGAFPFLAELIASSLTYVLFFMGMLLLLDDWRFPKKRMWWLMVFSILLLFPILNLGSYLVWVKQVYFAFIAFLIILCYRSLNAVFWLVLFTVWSMVGMCSVLSGLFSIPFDFQYRFIFKIILAVLTVLLFKRYIAPIIRELNRYPNKGAGYLCLIPIGLLIFLIFAALAMEGYKSGHAHFLLLVTLAFLFIFATEYGTLLFYFRILRQNQQDAYDNEMLISQMLSVTRRADEITKQDQAERSFRHDLRHTIKALAVCIDSGELTGAKELLVYLQEMTDGLAASRASILQYTGRPTLDATITCYVNLALESGIPCDVSIHLPQSPAFELSEFATVLANALENAINAYHRALPGKGLAGIRVLGQPTGGNYLLIISNDCSDDVRLDRLSGLPVTSAPGHGYGTRSIANFARKYQATLAYEVKNGRLTLRLLMPDGAAPIHKDIETPGLQ